MGWCHRAKGHFWILILIRIWSFHWINGIMIIWGRRRLFPYWFLWCFRHITGFESSNLTGTLVMDKVTSRWEVVKTPIPVFCGTLIFSSGGIQVSIEDKWLYLARLGCIFTEYIKNFLMVSLTAKEVDQFLHRKWNVTQWKMYRSVLTPCFMLKLVLQS